MDFNPVLLNMQPRYIQVALNSVKNSVSFPKVLFRGYTEPDVMEKINKFIEDSDYSHYIIHGDDCILPAQAVNTIIDYAKKGSATDVFTGWMNMCLEAAPKNTHQDGTLISNWDEWVLGKESTVCLDPLPPLRHSFKPEAFEYPKRETVTSMFKRPKELIQTSIACFAFTCASREIFLKYPLRTYPNGKASDHEFSVQLQKDGIPIWTHPDAFIKHLKRKQALWADYFWYTNVEGSNPWKRTDFTDVWTNQKWGHEPETIFFPGENKGWKRREEYDV